MLKQISYLCMVFTCLFMIATPAMAEQGFTAIEKRWVEAKYEITNEEARLDVLNKLAAQLTDTIKVPNQNADAYIWRGIVLSTKGSIIGGLSALGTVEQARDDFEHALTINPQAMKGAAHMYLGVLYGRVPGWPVAFGDDDKAEEHFRKALAINPDGMDVNFFYGEFLADEGEYQRAYDHFEKALSVEKRDGSKAADAGRRGEIGKAMKAIEGKLGSSRGKPSYN